MRSERESKQPVLFAMPGLKDLGGITTVDVVQMYCVKGRNIL